MAQDEEPLYRKTENGLEPVKLFHDGGHFAVFLDGEKILDGRGRAIVSLPEPLRDTYAFSSGT